MSHSICYSSSTHSKGYFLFFFLFLFAPLAQGQLLHFGGGAQEMLETTKNPKFEETLTSCLAKEEFEIHKSKTDGPIFQLNQAIFNEVVKIELFPVKKIYLEKICQNKTTSPSLTLLELLITHGKDLFDIPHDHEVQQSQINFNLMEDQLHDFLYFANRQFISYLATLNAVAPSAKCLQDHIPEMVVFLNKYQYLENENISYNQIFDKKEAVKVMQKIVKFDQIYQECLKHPHGNKVEGSRKDKK